MEWFTTLLGSLKLDKLAQIVWRKFRGPKLRLYFDEHETFHTRAVMDAGGVLGFFCHLMVRNEGKETAKGCRGRLLKVSIPNADGQFIPHPDFVAPAVLKWANEADWEPRDIETDLPRRLDLCWVLQPSPSVLRFFTQKIPLGSRTDFDPGIYQVKVRVDAENASPVDGLFTIRYSGVWNQISVSGPPA